MSVVEGDEMVTITVQDDGPGDGATLEASLPVPAGESGSGAVLDVVS